MKKKLFFFFFFYLRNMYRETPLTYLNKSSFNISSKPSLFKTLITFFSNENSNALKCNNANSNPITKALKHMNQQLLLPLAYPI